MFANELASGHHRLLARVRIYAGYAVIALNAVTSMCPRACAEVLTGAAFSGIGQAEHGMLEGLKEVLQEGFNRTIECVSVAVLLTCCPAHTGASCAGGARRLQCGACPVALPVAALRLGKMQTQLHVPRQPHAHRWWPGGGHQWSRSREGEPLLATNVSQSVRLLQHDVKPC